MAVELVSRDDILKIQPRLVESKDGAWLAVAAEGAPLVIGTWGSTEQEAREAFRRSLDDRLPVLAEDG